MLDREKCFKIQNDTKQQWKSNINKNFTWNRFKSFRRNTIIPLFPQLAHTLHSANNGLISFDYEDGKDIRYVCFSEKKKRKEALMPLTFVCFSKMESLDKFKSFHLYTHFFNHSTCTNPPRKYRISKSHSLHNSRHHYISWPTIHGVDYDRLNCEIWSGQVEC